jgi:hypothetical protein
VVKELERLEMAWLRILHRLSVRMGFSDPETAPTILLSRSSELLTCVVGNLSALCFKTGGCDHITDLKPGAREVHVRFRERLAVTFRGPTLPAIQAIRTRRYAGDTQA